MTASTILREKGSDVFTISPDATLVKAAAALRRRGVGAAVVLDERGAPYGVFSERDLTLAVGEHGISALEAPVSGLMSRRLVTAAPNTTVDTLMQMMTDRRVRHVIIMDGRKMTGIVSIGDVVKRKIADAEAEAQSLKAYIEGA